MIGTVLALLSMIEPRKLPLPTRQVRDAYLQLAMEIDRVVSGLAAGRLAGRIRCRPGCSNCCMEFSVLPLEAAMLLAGLDWRATGGQRRKGRKGRCLFLHDDRCTVYPRRPIICRTQGMALAYIDEIEERIEVSACPLNFAVDDVLEQEDLLFMDGFNERLAALNLRYSQDNGVAAAVRIALADLACPPA